MNNYKKYFSKWNLTRFISLVLILNFVLILTVNDLSKKEIISFLIRTTAKTSVLLFMLAFSASSLYYFWKNKHTKWLLQNRRYIGVSFAVAHYLHLVALLLMTFHISFNVFEDRGMFATIGGSIAYLFILIMAITSFDSYRKIVSSKNWNRIHIIGSYYIWIVFAQSYVPRMINIGGIYIPISILLIFVFLLRIWKLIKTRN